MGEGVERSFKESKCSTKDGNRTFCGLHARTGKEHGRDRSGDESMRKRRGKETDLSSGRGGFAG